MIHASAYVDDLSGLAVAYKAYHMSLNGEEPRVIDGLTGDQCFFIGWARSGGAYTAMRILKCD